MLAKPTKSIGEVLDRFEGREFTCEYKYDGERAQIHFIPPKEEGKGSGETKVYSRNSEDMSKRYPDIVEQLPRIIKPEGRGKGGFVLDCECVAWDAKEERYTSLLICCWVGGLMVFRLLPFQVLSTRKRKDVQLSEVTVKVILFGFDILYLDGEVPPPTIPPHISSKDVVLTCCSHCCNIPSRREDNYYATISQKSKANSHSQKTWTQHPLKKSKPSSKKQSRIPVKVSW